MVPGSTLRYGSSFWMQTEMLRDLRMRPRAAVVMPLPTELTTPPVTKMNFGMLSVGPGAGQNKWRHLRECRPPRILQGAQKADKQPGRGRAYSWNCSVS